ncbi:hypothetical protein PHAMO_280142 [Magnetospirillum molischianum DSM 120]|uniref:Uncharacterized protein n=1 Tax=Magnetospirillum molischianum DSM 120 TaxID=1150626 RepID=H8FTC0_MAGML|nr:hypothetical protein PHAMO_280142 [Magnetospirillum molischianum DSM 120]
MDLPPPVRNPSRHAAVGGQITVDRSQTRFAMFRTLPPFKQRAELIAADRGGDFRGLFCTTRQRRRDGLPDLWAVARRFARFMRYNLTVGSAVAAGFEYAGLVGQHDRNAVANRIGQTGFVIDQFLATRIVAQRRVRSRCDQDFQQLGIERGRTVGHLYTPVSESRC